MSPATQLAENINQMPVAIETEDRGAYTLCFGELIQAGEHCECLDVVGEMVWDGGANAYKYTITVTWQPGGASVIHLEEVGARIPVGYSYEAESAADFPENLSTDEPDELLDSQGAYLLNWVLDTPLPDVSESDPVETQTFYITGEGSQSGHYAWVVANRTDIGAVGEITGDRYRITATATGSGDGKTTAKIVADVMMEEGTIHIVSWQISN
jgi:hypothetical protein